MNEEERADWLARAIDDLLHRDRSRRTEPPPPELDREELDALMRIARARADAADSLAHSGLKYESEVWQRVLDRLDRRRWSRRVRPFDTQPMDADDAAAARQLEEMEIGELREIARIRRELAERAASIAEAHRERVWQRVQSRLQPEPVKRWAFPFFRRRVREEQLSASIDRLAAGHDVSESGEEEIDDLVNIARTRRYWSQMARKAAEEREGQVWARIAEFVSQNHRSAPVRGALWPKLAMAGALGAMVVAAAVGPLPATGFAGHPMAGIARSIGEYIGVRETDTQPPVPPAANVSEGTDVTAAEASRMLGVRVLVAEAPAGFEQTSSLFFEEALTADEGGLFALTYAGPGESSIAIYQERASGGDFAVEGGAATAVTLSDGTPATYVEGMWQQADDGGLVWSEGGAQTLVFERGGVRTTVQYTGPEEDAPSLFAVAESLTAAE